MSSTGTSGVTYKDPFPMTGVGTSPPPGNGSTDDPITQIIPSTGSDTPIGLKEGAKVARQEMKLAIVKGIFGEVVAAQSVISKLFRNLKILFAIKHPETAQVLQDLREKCECILSIVRPIVHFATAVALPIVAKSVYTLAMANPVTAGIVCAATLGFVIAVHFGVGYWNKKLEEKIGVEIKEAEAKEATEKADAMIEEANEAKEKARVKNNEAESAQEEADEKAIQAAKAQNEAKAKTEQAKAAQKAVEKAPQDHTAQANAADTAKAAEEAKKVAKKAAKAAAEAQNVAKKKAQKAEKAQKEADTKAKQAKAAKKEAKQKLQEIEEVAQKTIEERQKKVDKAKKKVSAKTSKTNAARTDYDETVEEVERVKKEAEETAEAAKAAKQKAAEAAGAAIDAKEDAKDAVQDVKHATNREERQALRQAARDAQNQATAKAEEAADAKQNAKTAIAAQKEAAKRSRQAERAQNKAKKKLDKAEEAQKKVDAKLDKAEEAKRAAEAKLQEVIDKRKALKAAKLEVTQEELPEPETIEEAKEVEKKEKPRAGDFNTQNVKNNTATDAIQATEMRGKTDKASKDPKIENPDLSSSSKTGSHITADAELGNFKNMNIRQRKPKNKEASQSPDSKETQENIPPPNATGDSLAKNNTDKFPTPSDANPAADESSVTH